MSLEDAARILLDALVEAGVQHMLVGGLSSNYYGIARSTKDVDVVIQLGMPSELRKLEALLPAAFEFDPQVTFESITGNIRHIIRLKGTPFVIELFELAKDDYQQCRFARRRETFVPQLDRKVAIPCGEDVIVQKLRWGRPKDLEDVRDVWAVQGNRLDHAYIQDWCRRLNIMDRYEGVKAKVPDI
jgi:hypothetical protein